MSVPKNQIKPPQRPRSLSASPSPSPSPSQSAVSSLNPSHGLHSEISIESGYLKRIDPFTAQELSELMQLVAKKPKEKKKKKPQPFLLHPRRTFKVEDYMRVVFWRYGSVRNFDSPVKTIK